MADWSWKQAVAECVLDLVNRGSDSQFFLTDLYDYVPVLSGRFPRNRHVKQKLRQILQRLRDAGFLVFLGGGHYGLNLNYGELDVHEIPLTNVGHECPLTRRTVQNIRLRNTFLATEIKRRYDNICQVCRSPVLLVNRTHYAEAHHLRPLGSPHHGPDVLGNIIVLCPNHHVMFDRGAATIEPDSLCLVHTEQGVFGSDARLYLESWHPLNRRYLDYHNGQVFHQSPSGNVA